MNSNLETVKKLAKDLRVEEPRPPAAELAGRPLAARCLDKCRATLAGTEGEFIYGCPMDQRFLSQAGLTADQFKDFVATGASDEEVARWLQENSKPA